MSDQEQKLRAAWDEFYAAMTAIEQKHNVSIAYDSDYQEWCIHSKRSTLLEHPSWLIATEKHNNDELQTISGYTFEFRES